MIEITRKRFLRTCGVITLTLGSTFFTACGEQIQATPNAPIVELPTTQIPPSQVPATTASSGVLATPQPTTGSIPTVTAATAPQPTAGNIPTASATTASPAPATNPPSATTEPATKPTTTPVPAPTPDFDQQAGQHMIMALPGTTLTPQIQQFLLTVKPGGIIMFGGNIASLSQIKQFNQDLQQFARQNNLPPFFIGVDEEGGIVSRMPTDSREWAAPSQMSQSAGGISAVQACARLAATRLKSLGFNLNFAPDADINNNPLNPVIGTRSYGSTTDVVTRNLQAALNEYQQAGLAVAIKHFPGHGDTDVDSHTGLPVIQKTLADLQNFELVPFKAAIAAGVPMIMTAHILFPKIEPNGLPATLSSVFLKNILRDQLGYKGLVVTDALGMKAISDQYGALIAPRLALQAGADLILNTADLSVLQEIHATLVNALKVGQLDLKDSLARITAFKKQYLSSASVPVAPASSQPYYQAAASGLTLLRHDGKTLPLTSAKPLLVNIGLASPLGVETQNPQTVLAGLWQSKFRGAAIAEFSYAPSNVEIERAVRAAQAAEAIVIVTRDTYGNPSQVKLVQALLNLKRPTLITSVRTPYDLLEFPQAPNVIAAYGDNLNSLLALLDALVTPNRKYTGRLPVSLPGLLAVGAGLDF